LARYSPRGADIPSRASQRAGSRATRYGWPHACALLAFVAGLVLACRSWQVPEIPPREVVRQRQPASIQVIRLDSSRLELRSPHIVGDSVVGASTDAPAGASNSPNLAIALSQISHVAIRQLDPVRTLVFIGAVVLGILVLLFAVAFGQALSMWYDELAETED